MPRSVRDISVNLNAGISKYMSEMDRAAVGTRQFGVVAGRAVDDYRDRTVRANRDVSNSWVDSADKIQASHTRNQSSLNSLIGNIERWAQSGGNAAETVLRGITKVSVASLEMVGAFRLGQLALRTQVAEVSNLEKGLEGVRNTVRATEVGLTGLQKGFAAALDVGTSIAAIMALEKVVETTYEHGKLLESQGVQAAKSKLPYTSVVELGFAAQRSGAPSNVFDEAAKAAGGVDALAQKLKQIGDIQDPIERTRAAFNAFGTDAERILPFLGDRVSENITRVREWGLALDQVDRERIGTFKRDVDSLKQSFVGLSDTMAAWSTNAGNWFSRAFGSIYGTMRALPGFMGSSVQTFTTAIGGPQVAFGEQPFDAAAAAKEARQQMGLGADFTGDAAMVKALRALQPAASKTFLANRGDQEEALKTRRSELQGQLFDSDVTSPSYGKLKPAASFPGGYAGQALAAQQYLSANQRIEAIEKAKEKPEIGVSPFEDRVKLLNAELEGLQAKLKAVGQPEAAQVLAKAFGESQKAIEEVNKSIEHHKAVKHEALDSDQKREAGSGQVIADTRAESALRTARIGGIELAKATQEAEIAWQTKFQSGTLSIADRIKSQELLTAAIGKGYEATRQANVESRLMQELGAHFNDPAWMQAHQPQVQSLRSGFSREFDTQHAEQSARAVDQLGDQIELERELARVQGQGAAAVREAALAVKLRQMEEVGASKEQIQAEKDLFAAKEQNNASSEVAKLEERILATQRLTAAIAGGAAAERQAALENRVAEIRRQGDTPVPGIIGIGQRELGERTLDQSEHQKQVTAEALKTGLEYQNQLGKINEQISALERMKVTQGDSLAIEISLRDLENERLKTLVEQSLQLRGARDGIRAFFLEMQEQAQSSAQIIYNSLNSALDRVSGNLAKLMTGQKTDWAKSFQQLGEQMAQSSIKSLAQQGLGKLGKMFGIDIGTGKPDGTSGNPIWVRMAGSGVSPSGGPSIPGLPGRGGVFGGGSRGGGIFSALGSLFKSGAAGSAGIPGLDTAMATTSAAGADMGWLSGMNFGGFMADGGSVEPGKVYGVGEEGFEYFAPRTSGSIIPRDKMGGGNSFTYHIDARGSDLGAQNRIARGIEASHRASVAVAVRATHERSMRTPGK